MSTYEGKTVVITGGGSGIGRCTAHEVAALGGHVVVTGRRQEKLDAVKAEIEAAEFAARMPLWGERLA